MEFKSYKIQIYQILFEENYIRCISTVSSPLDTDLEKELMCPDMYICKIVVYGVHKTNNSLQ